MVTMSLRRFRKHSPWIRSRSRIKYRGAVSSGERFQDLPSSPSRCRMLGHVEMNHPAPTMGQNHQNEQNPKSGGGHGKEIDGDQLVYVIVDERLPRLRRGFAASGQKSRHGSFGDEDTQLQ